MFCTTLRRRPSFVTVLPSLISSEGLRLRENRLETHDLAIPLNSTADPTTGNTTTTRQLRILLLSVSSATEPSLPNTLARIHHFASLTGGQDLAIIFLLNPPKTSNFTSAKSLTANAKSNKPDPGPDGILAYARLQAALLPRHDIPHIPILPLASLEVLPELLKKHVAALSRKFQPVRPTASPFEMLQLSTTGPPMDRQTAYFATDCFDSIAEMAVACSGHAVEPSLSEAVYGAAGSGRLTSSVGLGGGRDGLSRGAFQDVGSRSKLEQLRSLVDEKAYADLAEFWADEWVVE